MWTEPGKTDVSVSTVKPLDRLVTLYSGVWSLTSTGLWPYIFTIIVNFHIPSIVKAFHHMKLSLNGPYLEGGSGVVSSNRVGSRVGVNSVEDSRQYSLVWTEISSLKQKNQVKRCGRQMLGWGCHLHKAIGGSCFVIWRPCSTSFFLNNYINY